MERGDETEGPEVLEHKTPRWVKVFALIAVVLVVLLVFAIALGDGEHGPGRHAPSQGGHPPTVKVESVPDAVPPMAGFGWSAGRFP